MTPYARQEGDQTMSVQSPDLCLAFLCGTVVQPGIIYNNS